MHSLKILCAVLLAAAPAVLVAQNSGTMVLADVDHRKSLSLNGDWHVIVDPVESGLYTFHREFRTDGYFLNDELQPGSDKLIEYSFRKSPTIKVPGDWNSQDDKLFYYEGLLWYQRDFDYAPVAGHKTFLHIGAANYKSIAWVNGKKACEHEGGYTGFDCDVTALVRGGKNFVVIAVNNTRLADGVPTLSTDWWNYGGLTRDVSLIDTPASFIDAFDLHLNKDRTAIEGSVHVVGAAAGAVVNVSIPELHRDIKIELGANGAALLSMPAEGLQLWGPGHPKLYSVRLTAGEDTLEDDIGFRTIEVRGTDILLNGEPVFLRGISIHAEAPIRGGRVNTDADVATLLGWVKELGCNYVRLTHYPHDQRMTRATDKMGLLVWSEIPVYWAEHFGDPAVLQRAQSQLTEEIERDRNRASIALWSVANETPKTAERTAFLTTLASNVRSLDPTRLVTAALLVRGVGHTKFIDDPLGAALDVIGVNEYIGWYEGKPADADITEWKVGFDKPLIVSEFGADAKAGLHGPKTQRWTEEYQSDVYRHQLAMLARIGQLRGMSPWVLMDFRSPRRPLPGLEDNFNRKGLVSNTGEKKEAFGILQKSYADRAAEHAR